MASSLQLVAVIVLAATTLGQQGFPDYGNGMQGGYGQQGMMGQQGGFYPGGPQSNYGQNAQMGYPQTQMGYPQTQMGYPQTQMGYPQTQMGYPQTQMGYPQTQMGYPQTQMGLPQTARRDAMARGLGVGGLPQGHPSFQNGYECGKCTRHFKRCEHVCTRGRLEYPCVMCVGVKFDKCHPCWNMQGAMPY